MTPAERIAYEHGRRVVLDRREREARARRELWERVRRDHRPYVEAARTTNALPCDMFACAAINTEV